MASKQHVGLSGCPDCGAGLYCRTSEWQTPLFKSSYWVCKNQFCGSAFYGVTEITHRTSQSGTQGTSVDLPFTHEALRKMAKARELHQKGSQLETLSDEHS